MTVVWRVVAAGLAIGGILFAAGLMMPRHVGVERTIVIDAPADVVYGLVSNLREFNTWSPWARPGGGRAPVSFTYSGPEAGVGARMDWVGADPSLGDGAQEIIEAVPHRLVRSVLDLGETGKSMVFWRFDPVGEGASTRVTWGFSTDLGYNPMGRFHGLMFDERVGRDYEAGLDTLKSVAEKRARGGAGRGPTAGKRATAAIAGSGTL